MLNISLYFRFIPINLLVINPIIDSGITPIINICIVYITNAKTNVITKNKAYIVIIELLLI